jgi:hypothetical protein
LRGVDEEEEEKGRAAGSPNSFFRLFEIWGSFVIVGGGDERVPHGEKNFVVGNLVVVVLLLLSAQLSFSPTNKMWKKSPDSPPFLPYISQTLATTTTILGKRRKKGWLEW